MRTELVADALKAAAATRGSLAGAVFHTDHGAQYTSREFAELCSELGVTQSMGTVGTSADNAAAESFNASLKRETLQGARRYDGARTCRLAVFCQSPGFVEASVMRPGAPGRGCCVLR